MYLTASCAPSSYDFMSAILSPDASSASAMVVSLGLPISIL